MRFFLTKYIGDKKKVYVALRNVSGIGKTYSKILCTKNGISDKVIVKELTNEMLKQLTKCTNMDGFVNKELINSIATQIKKKKKIRTHQGIRHIQGLPVNGQNTKNNSKTAKRLLKDKTNGY
jgi:small subunit ribosomal protein S13